MMEGGKDEGEENESKKKRNCDNVILKKEDYKY